MPCSFDPDLVSRFNIPITFLTWLNSLWMTHLLHISHSVRKEGILLGIGLCSGNQKTFEDLDELKKNLFLVKFSKKKCYLCDHKPGDE